MKVSITTDNILTPLGIEEGFRAISEAGFDGVDFAFYEFLPLKTIYSGNLSSVFDLSDDAFLEAMRPYKEAAEKNNVSFCQAHSPFPNYIADERVDAYVLESVKKCLMACAYFSCPYLIVHPQFLSYDKMLSAEEEWDRNIAMYTALIPTIKRYRVTVCLENMFTQRGQKVMAAICADYALVNRYIDTLNEVAGEKCFAFCLDTGHANLVGQDLTRIIDILGPRMEALHIQDNDGWRDEHFFPYMGTIDWDRFCAALKSSGFSGALNFESANTFKVFAPELTTSLLHLLRDTGRLFLQKIEG